MRPLARAMLYCALLLALVTSWGKRLGSQPVSLTASSLSLTSSSISNGPSNASASPHFGVSLSSLSLSCVSVPSSSPVSPCFWLTLGVRHLFWSSLFLCFSLFLLCVCSSVCLCLYLSLCLLSLCGSVPGTPCTLTALGCGTPMCGCQAPAPFRSSAIPRTLI